MNSTDDLFEHKRKIDEHLAEWDTRKDDDSFISDCEKLLKSAQGDLNRLVSETPPYVLKKLNDAMSELESHLNKSKISKRTNFKFKSTPKVSGGQTNDEDQRRGSTISIESIRQVEKCVGFSDKKFEQLALRAHEVDSQRLELKRLVDCQIDVLGIADAAHFENLHRTKVTVALVSRSITVKECQDCEFLLVCQQLRIDSCKDCSFKVFIKSRSMLESSSGLRFSEAKIEDLHVNYPDVDKRQIGDMFVKAGIHSEQNNWRQIDDFECLSENSSRHNFVVE